MRKDNWKIKVNGQGQSVNDIINKFWRSRGIDNPQSFLYPSGNSLPSTNLKNIQKAANIAYIYIKNKSKFLIYAEEQPSASTSA